MTDEGLLNKQQRKKAARKQRKQSERQAHRNLDTITAVAIEEALRLAPLVADAPTMAESDRVIDVDLASLSEAQFVRKRVNDALNVGEWLHEIQTWIWQADLHHRDALSANGASAGFEIRIEKNPQV